MLATAATVLGALVFASSDQTARVASDAGVHADLTETAASLAAVRADVVVALAADATDSIDVRDEAIADARERLAGASEIAPAGVAGPVADIADDVHALVDDLVELGAAAVDDDASVLLADLRSVAGEVERERADVEARIAAEAGSSGSTARLASFAVALLAPVLVVWTLHRANRARETRLRLLADLERERAIGEAQTNLIAGLSHELRTPLTGITGFAEALLEADDDPTFTSEAARTIYDEAQDLGRMIEDVLVASRASRGELGVAAREVDVETEVATAIEPFRRAGREIALDIRPGTVVTDRLRLRHLLRNLVSNALVHGAQPVTVLGTVRDRHYTIVVEDHGPGFGESSLESYRGGFVHATERESTVAGSVGLGLSVAHTLADALGATLRLTRRSGTTWVSFDVPLATNMAPAETQQAPTP